TLKLTLERLAATVLPAIVRGSIAQTGHWCCGRRLPLERSLPAGNTLFRISRNHRLNNSCSTLVRAVIPMCVPQRLKVSWTLTCLSCSHAFDMPAAVSPPRRNEALNWLPPWSPWVTKTRLTAYPTLLPNPWFSEG